MSNLDGAVPTPTASPTSTRVSFPYLDNPSGRTSLLIHHHDGTIEIIRCDHAALHPGGVIGVRIMPDDLHSVAMSPSAWAYAQIIPTSELDIEEDESARAI